MAISQMSEVIQHLRRTVQLRNGAELTDGQLLEDCINRRDGTALEALMQRHGPMVWSVCCRVLNNHHDAEDAFQVTFLVLVRKAASIASRELLANWLYGVAYQTALKARATSAKRMARERQVMEMPEPKAVEQDLWYWGRSRKGNAVVKRKTARSRYRRTLGAIADWCQSNMHREVPEQHAKLSQKLHGHYGYFGITGNYRCLANLFYQVTRIWWKWLGRRSRKAYFSWPRFRSLWGQYPLPAPRVVHSVNRGTAKL